MKIPKKHGDVPVKKDFYVVVGIYVAAALWLLSTLGAYAQYTGAQPYAGTFGTGQYSQDDGELRVTNESKYPMVIAIEDAYGTVVDHAYVGIYQTHVFTGLSEGSYKYKAEVRDGGSYYEYIEGRSNFYVDNNICPQGYTCTGRAYRTLQLFYTRTSTPGAGTPKSINKQQFFN